MANSLPPPPLPASCKYFSDLRWRKMGPIKEDCPHPDHLNRKLITEETIVRATGQTEGKMELDVFY